MLNRKCGSSLRIQINLYVIFVTESLIADGDILLLLFIICYLGCIFMIN